jgi:predicted nucleotidyltransferase component of viral defense system
MIEEGTIQRLATQHHTTAMNIAREYCQHLLLSSLYRLKAADRVLFKGGTALRIVYGSPRFSEDLDFSGFGTGVPALEELLADALSAMERLGLALELEEAKATSGGYLGIIHSRFLDYHVEIQMEVSLRPRSAVKPSTSLIASELVPAYTLLHLPQDLLVEEKLRALLERGKPRDFYDVYFMLRKGLLSPSHRSVLAKAASRLTRMRPESFRELRLFLPKDQQPLMRDFRSTLERELRRYR